MNTLVREHDGTVVVGVAGTYTLNHDGDESVFDRLDQCFNTQLYLLHTLA